MNKETSISPEEWKRESQAGRVCGFIGCSGPPIWDCPDCGNSYCINHKDTHQMVQCGGENEKRN